jgi:hypothetical protein
MEKGAGACGVRPSSFESNPSAKSVKSVKSVVKTIFENGPAIELAQTVKQWSTTEEGSKKSTQDAITLKVGTAKTQRRKVQNDDGSATERSCYLARSPSPSF